MQRYRDWNISRKIFLPLISLSVLVGGACITALLVQFLGMRNDTMPVIEATTGLRQTSLELVGECRELMWSPDEDVQREIADARASHLVYLGDLRDTHENGLLAPETYERIERAAEGLTRHGDALVTSRLEARDLEIRIVSLLGEFEHDLSARPAQVDGDTVHGFPEHEHVRVLPVPVVEPAIPDRVQRKETKSDSGKS